MGFLATRTTRRCQSCWRKKSHQRPGTWNQERAADTAEEEAEQMKTPSAASCPGPGLPQRHSVQPGEGAEESRAADSIWRAKSRRWRSSWTNDCLDEEPASTRSPPGPSKVPAHLDVTQRGHGWWQGPCEPFLSWPSPCRDGLELAPTPGLQSQGSRRDAQGLL